MTTAGPYNCDSPSALDVNNWTSYASAYDGTLTTYATTSTAAQELTVDYATSPFSIPAGATIQGIVVEIYCYGDGGDYLTVNLKSSSRTATEKTVVPGTSAGWSSLGSSTDKWGATWTVAEFNDANNIAINAVYTNASKANTMYVGMFRMTVYYAIVITGTSKEVYNIFGKVGTTDKYIFNICKKVVCGNSTTTKTAITVAEDAGAGVAYNGKVWIAGGYPDGNNHYSYDPSTNTWDATPTDLPVNRWDAGSAVVGNKFYVIGGSSNSNAYNTVYIYDMDVGSSWTTGTASTYNHAKVGVSVHDGKIYCFGSAWYDTHLHSEYYDPGSNSWTTIADIPQNIWAATQTSVDGLIYLIRIVAGSDYTPNFWSYNPATNTYTELASLTPTTIVWTPLNLIAFGNRIYMFAGEYGGNLKTNKVFEYNILTNAWREVTSLTYARQYPTTVLLNSKVYVVGGRAGSSDTDVGTRYAYNEEYSFSGGTLVYKIFNKISSLKRIIYTIEAPGATVITSTKLVAYNIYSVVAQVTKTIYNVKSSIVAGKRVLYSILNNIYSTKRTIYNLFNKITSSDLLSYSIRGTIGSPKKIVYAIRNIVTTTDLYRYHVLNTIVINKTLLYTIAGRIGQSKLFVYNMAGAVVSQKRVIYSIRSAIGSSDRLLYNIFNSAYSPKRIIYNVINNISRTRLLSYNIINSVSSPKKIVYNIFNTISRTRQIQYNIVGTIAALNKYIYNLAGPIVITKKTIYNIRNYSKTTKTIIHNMRNFVSSAVGPKTKLPIPTAEDAGGGCAYGGKIYVAGGYPNGKKHYVYDPNYNTWSDAPTDLPVSRWDCGSAIVGQYFYILGGSSNGNAYNTVYRYDLINGGSWVTRTASTYNHAKVATCVHDGKIYCFGSAWYETHLHAEYYDPVADGWTTIADLPNNSWCATQVSVGGYIYLLRIVAGSDYVPNFWRYDPVANDYTEIASLTINGTISWSPLFLIARENRIYVFGGEIGGSLKTNRVFEYNITTNSWREVKSIVYPRQYANIVLGENNMVYVVGGRAGSSDGDAGTRYYWNEEYNLWGLSPVYQIRNLTASSFDKAIYNINNAISSSSKLLWTIEAALAQVTNAFSSVYNVRSLIGTTKRGVWNIRGLVSNSNRHLYNIRNIIAMTKKEIYSILGKISTTDKIIYGMRNIITATDSWYFNIRNVVVSQDKIIYNIINKATNTKLIIYNMGGAIQITKKLVYNVLNKIGSSDKYVYEILSKLSPSYDSYIYGIRTSIGTLDRLIYSVRSLISETVLIPYTIRNIITSHDRIIYNVINKVGSADRFIYSVRTLIAESFEQRYSILTAVVVTEIKRFYYNIIGRPMITKKMVYNLKNFVSAPKLLSYNIRAAVSGTRTIIYNALNRTGKTSKTIYNIYKKVNVLNTMVYRIRNYVALNRSVIYNIRNLIGERLSALYFVNNRIGYSPKVLWNIIGKVSSDFAFLYKMGIIYETITTSFGFEYDIYSIQILLMRDRLARYYRDKLVNVLRDFESPTIKMMESQVTGITWGPIKPNQTLYGSTVTIQFTFKGGEDWEE